MAKTKSTSLEKKGAIVRAMDAVERVGNALPNPATIFLILTAAVIVISAICGAAGVSVTYETIDTANGNAIVEKTVKAVNLLTPDSIRHLVTTVVSSFTGFFALGTVFTIMIGVGVADGSGMISALLRRAANSAPKTLVTAMVVFLGIMSNIASSTGYVVLVPLGAILFMAFGRHPIAGLAAAFAGVSGGWSANLLIGTNDPMFAGMSTQAAQTLDPNYLVTPVCNWFFMFVSTFLITAVGTFVTDKLVEPHLGKYEGAVDTATDTLTPAERKGLKFAGIASLIYVVLIVAAVAPSNGLLRNPETGGFLSSPFMSGIIFFIMLLFLISGIAYGIGAGTIKNDEDVIQLMNKCISGLASFMVLIFFAAQFTTCFNYSNLGTIISVSGANFLKGIGFVGLPLVICFIILTAFINIFHRGGQRQVGHYGAHLCPHVHAPRTLPGADPGCLPHRRFQHQHHRTPDALLRADGGLFPEVRQKGRHRQRHLHHAALLHLLPAGLDCAVLPLVPAGPAPWPRRSPLLPCVN